VRGHIRLAGHRRVSHGLFLPSGEEVDPHAEGEWHRELAAWRLVLPTGAAYTHLTGARLRNWQLPRLPEQVPVFAAVDRMDSRPRRAGLVCSRLERARPVEILHGLPVEPAEEILLRAARDLGLVDLLVLTDSARRHGDVDEQVMEELLTSRRPGVRLLRRAWELSTPKAESAGETLLRLFDHTMDVDVEPQAELFDEAGNMVGQADLLVVGTMLLHEYDGAHHREKGQQRTDLRRGRGLAQTSYDRRGFTLDDLLNHPAVAMHELDRDLGRRHDLRRLQRWRRLVEQSMYSEAGRRRLANRWQRQMGVAEWSRTAADPA
jgi:hypothetical protein